MLFVLNLFLPSIIFNSGSGFILDPSTLRAHQDNVLRQHDEFRLNTGGSSADELNQNEASQILPTVTKPDQKTLNWQRTSDDLQFQSDNHHINKQEAFIRDDHNQSALATKRNWSLIAYLLRSGDIGIHSDEPQQRNVRQALHFQNFFREQCVSHLIRAYLNMVPDKNQTGQPMYKYIGELGPSSDYYDLFAVIKYKPNIYHFINKKANRTLCVSRNGALYSAPLEFYTHVDSHECIFERVPVSNRTWCPNQNGLGGGVYLTTAGERRALAMTWRPKATGPEVITIPWSDETGPVSGCSPPPSGCYSWREDIEYNCGVDGNDDCVTYSTAKSKTSPATLSTLPSPSTKREVLLSTTTTAPITATSTTDSTLPLTSATNTSALLNRTTRSREGRKCAMNYCKSRAEMRLQSGHPQTPAEIERCFQDFLGKLRLFGEELRSRLCYHQGFGTKAPNKQPTLNVPSTSSESGNTKSRERQ